MILLFSNVANPNSFLESHWNLMYDDIVNKLKNLFGNSNLHIPEYELKNYVLFELEKLLNTNSSSSENFNLPMPNGSLHQNLTNRLLREKLDYETNALREEHIQLLESLNIEQKQIYDKVITTVNEKRGGYFFVYGHGGTGKTYLWRIIM